jgi:predicted amidophosphoribosyltransferase
LGLLRSVCEVCWDEITRQSPQISWLPVDGYYLAIASGSFYAGPIKKLLYHLKYDDDVQLTDDLSLLLKIAWRKLEPTMLVQTH